MKKLLACLCLTVSFTSFASDDHKMESRGFSTLYSSKTKSEIEPGEILSILSLDRLRDLLGNDSSNQILNDVVKFPNLQILDLSKNLYFHSDTLSGPIPKSIGQLTNLNHLDLSNKRLTGSIPNSIGQLTNLKSLILDHNLLAGAIPDSIGQLTNLEVLNLFHNPLEGSIPNSIGQLTDLIRLDLSRTRLTGPIPNSIGQLTNLSHLDLSYNELEGPIPDLIGQLTYLSHLDLSYNQLTVMPISMINLKYSHINLTNNRISCVTHEENQTLRRSNSQKDIIVGVGKRASAEKDDSIGIMNTIIYLRNLKINSPLTQNISVHFSHVQGTEFAPFENLYLSLATMRLSSRPNTEPVYPPYGEAMDEVLTIIQQGELLPLPIKSARK